MTSLLSLFRFLGFGLYVVGPVEEVGPAISSISSQRFPTSSASVARGQGTNPTTLFINRRSSLCRTRKHSVINNRIMHVKSTYVGFKEHLWVHDLC